MDKQNAYKLDQELQQRQRPAGLSRPLLMLFVMLIICAGLFLIKQYGQPTFNRPKTSIPPTSHLLMLPKTYGTDAFILASPDSNGANDLLYYTKTSKGTVNNLTNTPAISETWPVLSPMGDSVAYYAFKSNGLDVNLLILPDGPFQSLTEAAGKSGLHTTYEIVPTHILEFSPDSQWVAFLGENQQLGTTKLFVASTSAQHVLPIDGRGNNPLDFDWLDNSTLLVTTKTIENQLNLWSVSITSTATLQFNAYP